MPKKTRKRNKSNTPKPPGSSRIKVGLDRAENVLKAGEEMLARGELLIPQEPQPKTPKSPKSGAKTKPDSPPEFGLMDYMQRFGLEAARLYLLRMRGPKESRTRGSFEFQRKGMEPAFERWLYHLNAEATEGVPAPVINGVVSLAPPPRKWKAVTLKALKEAFRNYLVGYRKPRGFDPSVQEEKQRKLVDDLTVELARIEKDCGDVERQYNTAKNVFTDLENAVPAEYSAEWVRRYAHAKSTMKIAQENYEAKRLERDALQAKLDAAKAVVRAAEENVWTEGKLGELGTILGPYFPHPVQMVMDLEEVAETNENMLKCEGPYKAFRFTDSERMEIERDIEKDRQLAANLRAALADYEDVKEIVDALGWARPTGAPKLVVDGRIMQDFDESDSSKPEASPAPIQPLNCQAQASKTGQAQASTEPQKCEDGAQPAVPKFTPAAPAVGTASTAKTTLVAKPAAQPSAPQTELGLDPVVSPAKGAAKSSESGSANGPAKASASRKQSEPYDFDERKWTRIRSVLGGLRNLGIHVEEIGKSGVWRATETDPAHYGFLDLMRSYKVIPDTLDGGKPCRWGLQFLRRPPNKVTNQLIDRGFHYGTDFPGALICKSIPEIFSTMATLEAEGLVFGDADC